MSSLAVVFYVLVIPYTVSHMSWAYLFVSVLLTLSVLYALGRTAMRDPGFYPRSPPHSEVELGYVSTTIVQALCVILIHMLSCMQPGTQNI